MVGRKLLGCHILLVSGYGGVGAEWGGGRAPCGFMGCGMGSTIAQCEGCGVLQDGIFSNRMQCCSERAWEMELLQQCSCGTVHFLHLWGSRALGFCALMVGGRLREGGAEVQARRGRAACVRIQRGRGQCSVPGAGPLHVGGGRRAGCGAGPRCAPVATVPSGRRSDLGPSLGHFHAERPGQVTHLSCVSISPSVNQG